MLLEGGETSLRHLPQEGGCSPPLLGPGLPTWSAASGTPWTRGIFPPSGGITRPTPEKPTPRYPHPIMKEPLRLGSMTPGPHPHPHPHPGYRPGYYPALRGDFRSLMADPRFHRSLVPIPMSHMFLSAKYPAGKKVFQCPQCAYVTDRKNNLKRHVTTMHADCGRTLECCDVVFRSKASLREHVLLFHRTGYRCRFCGRNFCRKALLKRHVAVHNGQKNFNCGTCEYSTSHKSNLERHQRVHTGEDMDDTGNHDDIRSERYPREGAASPFLSSDEDIDIDIDGYDSVSELSEESGKQVSLVPMVTDTEIQHGNDSKKEWENDIRYDSRMQCENELRGPENDTGYHKSSEQCENEVMYPHSKKQCENTVKQFNSVVKTETSSRNNCESDSQYLNSKRTFESDLTHSDSKQQCENNVDEPDSRMKCETEISHGIKSGSRTECEQDKPFYGTSSFHNHSFGQGGLFPPAKGVNTGVNIDVNNDVNKGVNKGVNMFPGGSREGAGYQDRWMLASRYWAAQRTTWSYTGGETDGHRVLNTGEQVYQPRSDLYQSSALGDTVKKRNACRKHRYLLSARLQATHQRAEVRPGAEDPTDLPHDSRTLTLPDPQHPQTAPQHPLPAPPHLQPAAQDAPPTPQHPQTAPQNPRTAPQHPRTAPQHPHTAPHTGWKRLFARPYKCSECTRAFSTQCTLEAHLSECTTGHPLPPCPVTRNSDNDQTRDVRADGRRGCGRPGGDDVAVSDNTGNGLPMSHEDRSHTDPRVCHTPCDLSFTRKAQTTCPQSCVPLNLTTNAPKQTQTQAEGFLEHPGTPAKEDVSGKGSGDPDKLETVDSDVRSETYTKLPLKKRSVNSP